MIKASIAQLPKDWVIDTISNLTNNLDNRRIPLNQAQRAEKEGNGSYPYVGANNIVGYIDEYIFDEEILCIAEDGGSWGYNETCAFIMNEKCWVNNHAHVITAKNNIVLTYLKYYLNYADLNLYINGATRGKLNQSALNKIEIPLPPLAEQQQIAAILDAADSLRQKDQQLIDQYTVLSQSLFLDMFGDPFEGQTCAIGENIEILGGYAFKSADFVKEGIPLIKIGTVNKGYFDTSNLSYLPFKYADKYSKWLISEGDVLISLTGTVGKEDYGNVEQASSDYEYYFLNQRVAKISPSNGSYLNEFLYGMFSNSRTKYQLTKISRGVRQANISNGDILKLSMIKPPLSQQQKYVQAVNLINEQKQQAQASLEKSEALFNSLLQRAFNGELTCSKTKAA